MIKRLLHVTISVLLVINQTAAQQIDFVHEFNAAGDGNPKPLFQHAGKLYLTAENASGNALYTLDASTSAVECISCPYHTEFYYGGHGILNNKVFLNITTGANKSKLFSTDGTSAGTQVVKDIYPGKYCAAADFVNYNGLLYFSATDSAYGNELWVTDGTEAGTYMFWDFEAGTIGGYPRDLFIWNNKIYFCVNRGVKTDLYCTDATIPGMQVINTHFGQSSYIDGVDSISSLLVYSMNDSIFTINPANNQVSQLATRKYYSMSSFTHYKNKLYFSSSLNPEGNEVCVTDGTSSGTSIFFDSDESVSISSAQPFVFNNLLFFSASHNNKGFEPWVTDGNPSNTAMFKDLCVTDPAFSSRPGQYTAYNGKFYFGAKDCVTNTSQLFQSDGTVLGTTVVYNPQTSVADNLAYNFFEFNGSLYFAGKYDVKGTELYKLSTPTGITESESEVALSIYPNPATNFLNISTPAKGGEIRVLNFAGREMLRISVSESKTVLPLYELESGIYLVGYNGHYAKFIKQ
ncbi:MAG: T9SS type A sorting domain-containing protein [Chitinophagales bacterium]